MDIVEKVPGYCGDSAGTVQEQYWNSAMTELGQCGDMEGTVWGLYCTMQRQSRGRDVTVQELYLGHAGTVQGNCADSPGRVQG